MPKRRSRQRLSRKLTALHLPQDAQIAELEARLAELEASDAGVLKKSLEEAMRKCQQLDVKLMRVTNQNAKADKANRSLDDQLKESRNLVNQAKKQRNEARAVCHPPPHKPLHTFDTFVSTSLTFTF